MKRNVLLLLLLLSILKVTPIGYNITRYGAVADSTTMNTLAIQKAIDAAAASGGGKIIIPKGIFLSGALFFKPNTHLYLEKGAVLKGSDNIADYPYIPSRMEGQSLNYFAALVNAYNVEGFTISGKGKIDGNGLKYWKQFWNRRDSMRRIGKEATNLEVSRPRLVFLWKCNKAVLRDVKFHNSGFWTIHIYQSNDITIENADIQSPLAPVPAPSTDGIDLDVCKNVLIRRCYIAVNDDAIAIKGGKGPAAHLQPENGAVENVLIEKCTFGPSHATLTMGSECLNARNIILRNCKINNDGPVLNLKMRPDTYQVYENISIENLRGKCGTLLRMKPWKQFYNPEGEEGKPYGVIQNIQFNGIKMDGKSFVDVEGNPNDSVQKILFKNISYKADNMKYNNKYCTSTIYENVKLNNQVLVENK